MLTTVIQHPAKAGAQQLNTRSRQAVTFAAAAALLCSTPLMAVPTAPAKPQLAWQESNVSLINGQINIPIQWDMWWGTNGNQWTLSQNGVQIHSAALTKNGQNAQNGSIAVPVSAAGSYEYIVQLCNLEGSEQSCTSSDARLVQVAAGSGGDGGDGGDTGSVPAPAKPSLNWQETSLSLSNGQVSIPVSWSMWWGTNGNEWNLLQNGTQVYSASLTPNGTNAQSGSTSSTVTTAGTYNFVVQLCNVQGTVKNCTLSDSRSINVSGSNAGGGDTGGGDDGFDPWTDINVGAYPQPLKQNNVAHSNSTGKMVGGYFVEWGIYGRNYHVADIPAKNLTHLFYGFIPVCGPNSSLNDANPQGYSALMAQCAGKPDYTVVVHDKFAALEKSYPADSWDQPVRGIFAELYRLKKTQPHLKILPSVGGWTLSDPLYTIGVDAQARATFVASIVDMIKTYDFFDGVDIDWEFPGGGGAHPTLGSAQDGAGFALLMRDLRLAMNALSAETGRTYQLTAAMSGGVQKLQLVDWEAAHPYMDYINLMTYDYYGAWNGVLGHQATLYPNPNSPLPGFSADEAVQHLLSRQVPAGKITLGAAMYGRGWKNVSNLSGNNPFTGTGGAGISGSWEAGIEDYKKIEADYMGGVNGTGANGFSLLWDDTAKASYVWNSAVGTLISFDTKRSVQAKGNYVLQHQLGGIFAWELDADNGHILNAMHEGLGHPAQ